MFVQVNASNGVPVYDQIARQVAFAVADGVLTTGDLVPSVRELAKEIAVNPNTVARAYRELQTQGVVEPAPGIGLVVCAGARRACQSQRRSLLRERVRSMLRETLDAGLPPHEARDLVLGELDKIAPPQ
ncbi:GntR family transcriptional regulator [Botrimarina mediterranea]|uniref:HTH-type transcriptional repressor YtrA n=1 Tax=Botrimarina mediterranea TaxID=2528022 RepID=A0A518KDX7_9BACT|nr:GntR family transcriptional regulator [Botrimarina mediterranea]QDV75969.1 HTH-type transcriptional repressor YtrA [Botrimarina mediterranea]QDV80564.1 HTH-type transcriptional repressor YtrA [Planctomycetes bacterium K2D]